MIWPTTLAHGVAIPENAILPTADPVTELTAETDPTKVVVIDAAPSVVAAATSTVPAKAILLTIPPTVVPCAVTSPTNDVVIEAAPRVVAATTSTSPAKLRLEIICPVVVQVAVEEPANGTVADNAADVEQVAPVDPARVVETSKSPIAEQTPEEVPTNA